MLGREETLPSDLDFTSSCKMLKNIIEHRKRTRSQNGTWEDNNFVKLR